MHNNQPSLGKLAFKISFGGYLGWHMARLVNNVVADITISTVKGLKTRLETKQA